MTSGVHQGCVLALALFCRAIDCIMDSMTCLVGVTVARDRFGDLDYANDIVLLVNAHNEPVLCLADFSLSAKKMGHNVSWPKTKIHCLRVSRAQSLTHY